MVLEVRSQAMPRLASLLRASPAEAEMSYLELEVI